MLEQVRLIEDKLKRLRELDKRLEIFGSASHRYISRKVSLNELADFEKKHKITFPDEFRVFLLSIGSGAGPDYGIYSLEQMRLTYEDWSSSLPGTKGFNTPFEISATDAAFLLEQKELNHKNEIVRKLTRADGILPVQTEGCTYFCYIVINGDNKGKIWSLDSDEYETVPLGNSQHFSFLDWYENWLNNSLAILTSEWKIKEHKNVQDTLPREDESWWHKIFGNQSVK